MQISRFRCTAPELHFLLMPQREQGVELGGFPRGVGAEGDAGGDGDDEGDDDGFGGDDGVEGHVAVHAGDPFGAVGGDDAEAGAERAADEGEDHRLGEKLDEDVALGGAEGAADADLTGALEDVGEHDVHDADAADEEGDGGDGGHHEGEDALGFLGGVHELVGDLEFVVVLGVADGEVAFEAVDGVGEAGEVFDFDVEHVVFGGGGGGAAADADGGAPEGVGHGEGDVDGVVDVVLAADAALAEAFEEADDGEGGAADVDGFAEGLEVAEEFDGGVDAEVAGGEHEAVVGVAEGLGAGVDDVAADEGEELGGGGDGGDVGFDLAGVNVGGDFAEGDEFADVDEGVLDVVEVGFGEAVHLDAAGGGGGAAAGGHGGLDAAQDDVVDALGFDLVDDAALAAFADGEHGDDGGDAEDDAEHGEERADEVAREAGVDGEDDFEDGHGLGGEGDGAVVDVNHV